MVLPFSGLWSSSVCLVSCASLFVYPPSHVRPVEGLPTQVLGRPEGEPASWFCHIFHVFTIS